MILSVALTFGLVTVLFSCRTNSSPQARTIAAKTLAEKYSVSIEAARREFDGKELLVEGYVLTVAAVPRNDEGEGTILLGSERDGSNGVQCWFTRYESAEFEGIGAGTAITVKGVFNGETGPVLKFCKLVKRSGADSVTGP